MAKARDKSSEKIAHLRSLDLAPSSEQFEYALQLLETESHLEVLQAALAVLTEMGNPKARPALLQKYQTLASDGVHNDPGCFVRSLLLRALQPIVQVEDIAFLEEATRTYEYQPPGRADEVGAGLRSMALIALHEIDEMLAGYAAVRLLDDPRTSRMSGEPAITAVQVLAAQGQFLPLYGYLLRDTRDDEGSSIAEVVAECLRSLTRLPQSLLDTLVKRYSNSSIEIVLLGLFDLLQAHEAKADYASFTLKFLLETRHMNIYRYLVIGLVARKEEATLAKLQVAAKKEKNAAKALILEEAKAIHSSRQDK